MFKPRKSVESYAHKAAKQVMTDWLRSAAVRNSGFGGLSWRANRPAPHFGIWEEYPVMPCAGLSDQDQAWDELDAKWSDRPPTFRELVRAGCAPAAILDIAIQHKGLIAAGIEINHRHGLTREKIDLLNSSGLGCLLEIPANWILDQVRPPDRIPAEFWKIGQPR